MSTKSLAVVLAVIMVLFILELVRREKMTFKYAAGWLLVSVGAMFLAIFDNILRQMSEFFGFALTSNFIFFAALCGFVFLSLILTIFLCQQNIRNDKIVQKLGMLENELEELKGGRQSKN